MPIQRVIDLKQLKKILKEESGKFPKPPPPTKARAKDISIYQANRDMAGKKAEKNPRRQIKKNNFESVNSEKSVLANKPDIDRFQAGGERKTNIGQGNIFLNKFRKKEKLIVPVDKNEPEAVKGRSYVSGSILEKEDEYAARDDMKKNEAISRFASALRWQAPEYEKPEKPGERAIIGGIIAAGFFAGAIFIGNYLLSLIVFLTYVVFYIYTFREPKLVEFSITDRGVRIDDKIYEYGELRSFCIFFEPPYQKILSLESGKVIMPYIRIPLEGVDPIELKNALMKHLPERRHKESLIDA